MLGCRKDKHGSYVTETRISGEFIMQKYVCSCKLGESFQINKFLSRKLIIHPGLPAWIIYSRKLWVLCTERVFTVCEEIHQLVVESKRHQSSTPSSHNSRTWNCISSAHLPTPCRGQVVHVEVRSWRLTFDIFPPSSFLVRDWLESFFQLKMFSLQAASRFASNSTSSRRLCSKWN